MINYCGSENRENKSYHKDMTNVHDEIKHSVKDKQ